MNELISAVQSQREPVTYHSAAGHQTIASVKGLWLREPAWARGRRVSYPWSHCVVLQVAVDSLQSAWTQDGCVRITNCEAADSGGGGTVHPVHISPGGATPFILVVEPLAEDC